MSKYKPATREEFKEMCLRNLGKGMLQINVTDDQVEDSVEEGLKYFADYHYDGSQHTYYAHKLTGADITNRFITVPESLFGIVDVYDFRHRGLTSLASVDMFSFEYQMMVTTATAASQGSMLTYFMNRMAYDTFSQVLGNQTPLRFNRHTNKVYIDGEWERYQPDDYIVFDAYVRNDPDEFPDIWNDRWLIRYVTAKIKFKWGGNLSKYEGVPLPGGLTLNGSRYQDDAQAEIQQLEDEMMSSYSLNCRDIVG